MLFCTTTRPSPDYSGSLNSPPKRTMGGPNLEVFKFSVYVFFPVVMLFYYGNPDWYAKNVLPVRFALLRSCCIRCLDILLHSTRTGSSLLNTESSRCASLARESCECSAKRKHAQTQDIPTDSTTLKEELAKIKARNMERKAQREAEARAAHLAQQAAEEQKSAGRSWWPWGECGRSHFRLPGRSICSLCRSVMKRLKWLSLLAIAIPYPYPYIALVMIARRVPIVFLRAMHSAHRSTLYRTLGILMLWPFSATSHSAFAVSSASTMRSYSFRSASETLNPPHTTNTTVAGFSVEGTRA